MRYFVQLYKTTKTVLVYMKDFRNSQYGQRQTHISAASAHIPEMNLSAKPQNLRVLNFVKQLNYVCLQRMKKKCKRYLFKIANTMKCESLARAHAIDIK